jgi:hypothetical protein
MCYHESLSNTNHRIAEQLTANDNFLATGHRARSSSQLAFVVTYIFILFTVYVKLIELTGYTG